MLTASGLMYLLKSNGLAGPPCVTPVDIVDELLVLSPIVVTARAFPFM